MGTEEKAVKMQVGLGRDGHSPWTASSWKEEPSSGAVKGECDPAHT